jgi:8-oxo-dGTP diphosphatase
MYTYLYPRPALTVDAVVVAGHPSAYQLLLIERKKDPFAGKWALPGGFVDMEETLDQACIRELKEETGLELPEMEQFRVFDAINRDPRHRTVSVVFYAFISNQWQLPALTMPHWHSGFPLMISRRWPLTTTKL